MSKESAVSKFSQNFRGFDPLKISRSVGTSKKPATTINRFSVSSVKIKLKQFRQQTRIILRAVEWMGLKHKYVVDFVYQTHMAVNNHKLKVIKNYCISTMTSLYTKLLKIEIENIPECIQLPPFRAYS